MCRSNQNKIDWYALARAKFPRGAIHGSGEWAIFSRCAGLWEIFLYVHHENAQAKKAALDSNRCCDYCRGSQYHGWARLYPENVPAPQSSPAPAGDRNLFGY
jgi:hypothetical protein